MFTAKINRKENRGGAIEVFVDFTDGVSTYTDSCIPSDRDGFRFWVKSRLTVYNTAPDLQTELVPGADFDASDPVVTPPTQAQIDKDLWFAKYYELERLEQIAARNFLTGARLTVLNNKISTVKSFLDTNAKTEYLNFV